MVGVPPSSIWEFVWGKADDFPHEEEGGLALEDLRPGNEAKSDPVASEVLRRQRRRAHQRKASDGEHRRMHGVYEFG